VPDQVQFGPKYFLTFMLPDLKSKILTQLSEAKKEVGPTLFSLMGQFFQTLVSLSGPTLWANNAPWIRTSQRKTLTSASGTTSRQLLCESSIWGPKFPSKYQPNIALNPLKNQSCVGGYRQYMVDIWSCNIWAIPSFENIDKKLPPKLPARQEA
jgi:hypothetical protein